MSLQSRLADLITAIGADVKTLQAPRPIPFGPPSGGWLQPANVLSIAAGAPASGQVTYWPLDVGPAGLTIQSIGVNVTTARSGGTVVEKLGVYADDGTGGCPLLTSGGLLTSGTISLATLGVRTLAWSTTLGPGRYWGAFIYYASVAPTTAPQLTCCTNATTIWAPNATPFTANRYLANGTKTDLPTAAPAPAPISNSLGPVIALRAA